MKKTNLTTANVHTSRLLNSSAESALSTTIRPNLLETDKYSYICMIREPNNQ